MSTHVNPIENIDSIPSKLVYVLTP